MDRTERVTNEAALGELRAVAIDTNVFSTGNLGITALTEWAQLLDLIGLQLWIPEPVAWELAEHAAHAWEGAHATYRNNRRKLRQAGFDVHEWPERARSDLESEILAAIVGAHPNVVVIPLTPEDAVEALKDQVMLRPPAKRKGGTHDKPGLKTGASDSASVRLLNRYSAANGSYVVMGADRDWQAAYDHHGWVPPKFYDTWRSVRDHFFSVVSAVGAGPAVARYVSSNLLEYGAAHLQTVAGGGVFLGDPRKSVIATTTVEVEDVTSLAGVTDLAEVKGANQLSAGLIFFADIGVSTQEYNEQGRTWASNYEIHVDQLIRGEMVFSLSQDVIVSATTGSQLPLEVVRERRYYRAQDALEAVLTAMSCVPGLEVLEVSGLGLAEAAKRSWTGSLECGSDVTLRIETETDAVWSLTVQAAAGEGFDSEIRCETAADADLDQRDQLREDGSGEYVLAGASDCLRHPEWRLAADLLRFAGYKPPESL